MKKILKIDFFRKSLFLGKVKSSQVNEKSSNGFSCYLRNKFVPSVQSCPEFTKNPAKNKSKLCFDKTLYSGPILASSRPESDLILAGSDEEHVENPSIAGKNSTRILVGMDSRASF